MPNKDPRVDAFIEKSSGFAQPILRHLRGLIHKACPQVQEAMKWNMPFFEHQGVLCMLAAFKGHCAFRFWHPGMRNVFPGFDAGGALGQLGRITFLEDLPSDTQLLAAIKTAAALNEAGVQVVRVRKTKPVPKMPADFKAALGKSKKAQAVFEAFAPSHKREYMEWIVEAKRPETRAKRIATAVEWIGKGKSRNWKYE